MEPIDYWENDRIEKDLDTDLIKEIREKYACYEGMGDKPDFPRRRSAIYFFRLTALLVLLSFITFSLGGLLKVFTLPPLGFLADSSALSKDPWVQELQPAVVGVQVKLPGKPPMIGGERNGTGFNIRENGLIITNRHLVEDAAYVNVTFADLGTYRAKYWFSSPGIDLAVVELDPKEVKFPFVETTENMGLVEGEQVTVIGNPLGFSGVVMQGEVAGFQYMGETAEPLLEIKAPIHPGSSGSPVFNGKGQVVAVIFASINGETENDRKGLAIPISYLSDLLGE